MPIIDLTERRAVAVEAARRAGSHLRDLYEKRDTLVVEQKGVNDYVSRADREAESLIKDLFASRFPEDGFLGEETGTSGNAGARATWVVDPLDGTTNFLKGAHNWCVSIGLVVEDVASVGVIYDPLRDEMFESTVGGGVRVNQKSVAVSRADDLASATIGLGFVPRVGADLFCADTQRLLATGLSFRQVGAGALMLAYVAAGRVDAYFERHMWPWDAIAGLALIVEAGGIVADYPTGSSLRGGGLVLAAGPGLYPTLSQTLAL